MIFDEVAWFAFVLLLRRRWKVSMCLSDWLFGGLVWWWISSQQLLIFLVVKLGLLLVEAGKNSCHDDDDNDNFYVIRWCLLHACVHSRSHTYYLCMHHGWSGTHFSVQFIQTRQLDKKGLNSLIKLYREGE